jgi:hypothetical protein
MVAVQLKRAPPSKHKRWMMAFLVLTPLAFVLFIAGVAGYGTNEPVRMNYITNLEAISGVLMTVYGLCGCLFIAFADITFRSMQGPLTWSLGSPLFLRGVHLGLNLAGMFTLMPLFSFVGIPATLLNLRKIKTHSPGLFTASNVFGILSFVLLAAIVLLLIIAGSMRGNESQLPLTEILTLALFQWISNFLFIGFADKLILRAIGDKGGAAGGVANSQLVVHPCPSCSSPLQFVRTGPTTQVQCYKCQAIVEFDKTVCKLSPRERHHSESENDKEENDFESCQSD